MVSDEAVLANMRGGPAKGLQIQQACVVDIVVAAWAEDAETADKLLPDSYSAAFAICSGIGRVYLRDRGRTECVRH